MPKNSKVVPLTEPRKNQEEKPKVIASDQEGKRIIVGIGSQRLALDFYSKVTRLPPNTGDEPAPVISLTKKPKRRR